MKQGVRYGVLAALLGLSAGMVCVGDRSAPEVAGRIDKLVSRYAEYGYLNGTVLIGKNNQVIYAKGVGEANFQTHTPNTAKTKFGIASLTKQFTAVLVLQQVAEGKIHLDGKLTEYLPWYREDTGSRITIEQVLHHTAGLPPDYEMAEFSDTEAAKQQYEPREFAEKKCEANLVSEPGTQWNYSNCGYVLLGLVLEGVTGKPFAELLKEKLLGPLGMKDTGIDQNDLVEKGGATGYQRHAGARYTVGPDLDRSHIYAAGAMYSTAEDLFRWNQALSEGGAIPKEIRDQVFKPGLGDWGYGWFITKIPAGVPGAGNTLAEMRGDMPGNYFSWILRYPETDAVIIVLRNGYGSTERLEENLQAILFGAEPLAVSRSVKDLVAQGWWIPAEWVSAHKGMSMILLVPLAGMLWMAGRRRKAMARRR